MIFFGLPARARNMGNESSGEALFGKRFDQSAETARALQEFDVRSLVERDHIDRQTVGNGASLLRAAAMGLADHLSSPVFAFHWAAKAGLMASNSSRETSYEALMIWTTPRRHRGLSRCEKQ